MRPRRPVLPTLAALLTLLASPALAQVPGLPAPAAETAPSGTGATGTAAATEPTPFPGRAEIGPRYLELVDEAAEARRRLVDLTDLAALEEEVAATAERGEELAQEVDALLAHSQPRLDDLVLLHQAVEQHRDQVAAAAERLSGRIAELDQLREAWEERRELWSGWRRSLAEGGNLGAFAEDFQRALALIRQVVEAASEAVPRLARSQEPLRRAQERSLALLARLEGAAETERGALLVRDGPALLSAAHRAELAEGLTQPLFGSGALRSLTPLFFSRNAALLAAGLVLLLVVGFLVRHFRRRYPEAEEGWRILLSHPWVLGLFVAAAVTLPYYAAPPPLWRLLLLAAVAGSASVVTRGMFRNPGKRQVVYVLAAAYVGLRGLETFGFPPPWTRLLVAAVALVGVPLLLWLARREERTAARRTGFAWLLHGAAVVLTLVLVAQLLGYRSLGRWLLENGLATAFLAFVLVLLARLGRGALRAALQRPAGGRLVTLRRVGYELSGRLARGLELVLGGVAVLYLLTIWGVFPSPWQAWETVLQGGFSVGEHRITVAQVLLGILALYLAFVVSGVLRALVDEELGRRPELEPGVANSVATLVHYALVLVGLLVAVAALGFDLSTFAIVAGALGVGIGFGLQDIVNNFFSGLILLFERPVRVGDVVMIDNQWSVIKKIGLRSTVVTTYDYSDIIVPNGTLISEKVTNWTLSSKVTRILIPVGVAYGSDLETVFAILEETVAADERVATDPGPAVHFVGFGDSSLNFEIRVWITDISNRLNTRSDLLRAIDRRFREAGVVIPFPQRDVHLYPAPGPEARPASSPEPEP